MPTRFILFRRLLTIPIALLLGSSALVAQPTWKQVITPDAGGHISDMRVTHLTDGSGGTIVTVMQQRPTNGGTYCSQYYPDLDSVLVISSNQISSYTIEKWGYCDGLLEFYHDDHTVNSGAMWDFPAPYDPLRRLGGGCSLNEEYRHGYLGSCGNDGGNTRFFHFKVNLSGDAMSDSATLIDSLQFGGVNLSISENAPPLNIFFHPIDGTILFATSNSGLHYIEIAKPGITGSMPDWKILKSGTLPSHFTVEPEEPNVYYYSTYDTLWISTDKGNNWRDALNQTVTAIRHVPNTSTVLAGSSQEVGGGLYSSIDNGITFQRVLIDPIFAVDISTSTGTVFASGQGKIYFSTNGGKSFDNWIPSPNNLPIIGVAATKTTLTCADSTGVYALQLSSAVGETHIAPNSLSLTISPNPFSMETRYLLANAHAFSELKIIDLMGRIVARFSPHDSGIIDGSCLLSGLFFLQANGGNNHVTVPLVHLP